MGASISQFLSSEIGYNAADVQEHETGTLSVSEQTVEQDRIDSEPCATSLGPSDQFSGLDAPAFTNEPAYTGYTHSLSLRSSVECDIAPVASHNNEYLRLVDRIRYLLAISILDGDPWSAFTDEILESLSQPPKAMMAPNQQKYINIQHLSSLLLDPDVFNIIRYLVQLAHSLGLGELSTMHLEPYLYLQSSSFSD